MSKIDKIISNKIKTLREKAGYTQQDVADFMGMELVRIKLIEQGGYTLSPTNIYHLCFILDCKPDEMFPPLKNPKSERKQEMKEAIKEIIKKLCV
jgi:transcriptional regulator with XRE-family HTH domain